VRLWFCVPRALLPVEEFKFGELIDVVGRCLLGDLFAFGADGR
jgi:hypothetical protein